MLPISSSTSTSGQSQPGAPAHRDSSEIEKLAHQTLSGSREHIERLKEASKAISNYIEKNRIKLTDSRIQEGTQLMKELKYEIESCEKDYRLNVEAFCNIRFDALIVLQENDGIDNFSTDVSANEGETEIPGE